MKIKLVVLFAFLHMCVFSFTVFADETFSVSIRSDGIQEAAELGNLAIDGVGVVSFSAKRNGNQLVVHAYEAEGKKIGRAETIVGLIETPLYIQSPKGLQKIVIKWGTQKEEKKSKKM